MKIVAKTSSVCGLFSLFSTKLLMWNDKGDLGAKKINTKRCREKIIKKRERLRKS
jgi:hypothetical protein